jgi:type II secretory pathway component PulJ
MIELLISAALFSVIATGAYVLYISMLNTYTKGELCADVQQSARIAMAQIIQDLRGAGYDPEGAMPKVATGPKAMLRAAMPSCLAFVTFGTSEGSEVSVQIAYTLGTGSLLRRSDRWDDTSAFTSSSWASVAQSIDSLQFTYYDADGAMLVPGTEPPAGRCPPSSSGPPPPVLQLSVEQMRQVRRIEIALRATASAPRRVSEYPEQFVLSSNVHLRNR